MTKYAGYAVPIFMLVSFYFGNISENNDIVKFRKRIKRLLIPQCFWALLYYIVYLHWKTDVRNVAIVGNQVGYIDFIWQLLLGSSLNPPLWFLSDLIILYILFYLVFVLFKEYGIITSICVGIVSLVLQYTGLNYEFFGNLPEYSKWSIGRLCELIPVAVIGIVLSKYKILNRLNRKLTICCSLAGLMLVRYLPYIPCEGFMYQGVHQTIIPVLITILFYCLPFGLLPTVICSVINKWSEYNMGIIALHYMVANILLSVLSMDYPLPIMHCLIIYFICLMVTNVATSIPIKVIKQSFT